MRLVNEGRSPIADTEIEARLASGGLRLRATSDPVGAYSGAELVVVATPTNYDPETLYFDTSSVESVIDDVLAVAPRAIIVIKSTIPVGFTKRMQSLRPDARILFSPEFLREGHALYDNLHPSRIIVADPGPDAEVFAGLLVEGAEDADPPVMFTGSTEAEAIKLLSLIHI